MIQRWISLSAIMVLAVLVCAGCAQNAQRVHVPPPASLGDTVQVFFATDRSCPADCDSETQRRFEATRSEKGLTYGRRCLQATTTAPDALRSCSPSQEIFSNQDAFFAHLEAAVHESKTQQVLLFVHGFNVDLASATEKAAVLRIGTGFDGVVVAYSWPSAGKLLHYYYDQENNEWTIPHLRDFIAQLGQHVPEKHLHILAHSMGSRALIHALYSMPNPPEFGQLLLAAPDIDSGVFEDMVRSLRTFDGKTIYVSNHDKALKASRKLHGDYPRLGDSKNTHYISRDAGIEVVDVSALKGDITGHLYYSGQPLVLGDIGHILQGKGSAAQECGPSKKPKSIRELCRITTRTESQKCDME